MSSTPPAPHTPPPVHYPGSRGRVGHRLPPSVIVALIAAVILIAAAVTAVIVFNGTTSRPEPPELLPSSHAAMAAPAQPGVSRQPDRAGDLAHTPATVPGMAVELTSADPITIADGISIAIAPGWTLTDRGPNSVTVSDADNTARMQVTVKPASGADVTAALRADIDALTARTHLTNLRVSGPLQTRALRSNNFQQAASMNYTADNFAALGVTHLMCVFMELLNTSNHQSAFIDYRQTSDAHIGFAAGGQLMINSML